MDKCIVLIGVKHSGKTTAGKLFAEQLDLPFFDIDTIIERQNGKTCRELYSSEGVEAFQKAEAEACKFFIEASKNIVSGASGIKGVVAVGGGLCDNTSAIELLHPVGFFVYLDVPNHIAFERILQTSNSSKSIPATFMHANPQNEEDMRKIFYEQYERRSNSYRAIADIIINTEGLDPNEIVREIIKQSIPKK